MLLILQHGTTGNTAKSTCVLPRINTGFIAPFGCHHIMPSHPCNAAGNRARTLNSNTKRSCHAQTPACDSMVTRPDKPQWPHMRTNNPTCAPTTPTKLQRHSAAHHHTEAAPAYPDPCKTKVQTPRQRGVHPRWPSPHAAAHNPAVSPRNPDPGTLSSAARAPLTPATRSASWGPGGTPRAPPGTSLAWAQTPAS